MTQHVLDLQGTGFFSRGSCTGCVWSMKGHADEITRVWERYHEFEEPLSVPARVVVPAPLDEGFSDSLERRIIVLLTHRIDFQRPQALYVALGLAEARSYWLRETDRDPGDPQDYVSTLMGRIAVLSKRQREKLRHPTRTRAEQQAILEQK